MKDPLHTDATPYEILGVDRDASEADITTAFKAALLKTRNVNALNAARLTLMRPVERTLVDLFMYRRNALLKLTPDPEGTLLSVARFPRVRADLLAQWEQVLRPQFPNLELLHTLGVMHWWGARQAAQADLWKAVLGHWVTIAHHPALPLLVTHGMALSLTDLQSAIIERLKAEVLRMMSQGGSAWREMSALLELEVEAARAVHQLGLRTNGTVMSSGPIALARAGLLAPLRRHVSSPQFHSAALTAVRHLLDPFALVRRKLHCRDFDGALHTLDELAEGGHPNEAVAMRIEVLRSKARQQWEVGRFDEALDAWEGALRCSPPPEVIEAIESDLSESTIRAAAKLTDLNPRERVEVLERVTNLMTNQDLDFLLARSLYERAAFDRTLFRVMPPPSEEEVEAHTRILKDLERAVHLGFSPATSLLWTVRSEHLEILRRARRRTSLSPGALRLTRVWLHRLGGGGGAAAFSTDGSRLAVAEVGGVRVWRMPDHDLECFARLEAPCSLSFTGPSTSNVYFGSVRGRVGLLGLNALGVASSCENLDVRRQGPATVAPSPDAQWIACTYAGTDWVAVYSAKTNMRETLFTHKPVRCLAAYAGQTEWLCCDEEMVHVFGPCDLVVSTVYRSPLSITSLAISRSGKTVALGSQEGRIEIVDARRWKRVRLLEGHRGPVRCLAFSPDGKLLASGGDDSNVRLHAVRNACEIHSVEHETAVSSVAFSPTKRWLAATSDKAVSMYRIRSRVP